MWWHVDDEMRNLSYQQARIRVYLELLHLMGQSSSMPPHYKLWSNS